MGNSSNNAKGTVLITGANGSLGSALVSRLLSTPETAAYHGIYTARNADSAPALRSALQKGKLAGSHSYDVISLELTNLAAVRTTAAMINKRVAAGEIPPIRALVLNAGYLEFLRQTWTEDGFDMTFASNYLGHWLLAILLLQSMDRQAGRIVVIGSESHDLHNSKSKAAFNEEKWMVFLDDHGCDAIARGTWSTNKEDPSFYSPELQRRLDADPEFSNICVLGIDPGSIATDITRRGPWLIRVLIFGIIVPLIARIAVWLNPNGPIRTIDRGTADILAAALGFDEPIWESPKAMYFYGSRVEEMTAEAMDEKKRQLLWKDTLGYTNLKKGETVLANWM
ncbi:hypothetical protein N0V93_009805 [Gnomoniopsis smithogilvyi]|uniref:3beta-hydroxysteroid 3-dehydrogenase n=1 Tax=Gnomoniopsis smithogilvyi TaxID=1191159 RepID=A0A9W8YHQ2_9PEZI|nr:hypothetical protein N0V93_009805 [Gnomoniopsis smithogilvyi]